MGGRLARGAARLFLRVTGWQPEGDAPSEARFVLIAAPHTSNWDLAFLLALATIYGIRISWMGKHTLFRGPMGTMMRAVGGIPVVRHERLNMVDLMAAEFGERERFALVVPAEATRARAEYWKSGFYHIANQARVPIVMGYLDYPSRRGGFGPGLLPSGDVKRDMDQVRAFYADKTGRHPDLFGPIRLREERPVSAD